MGLFADMGLDPEADGKLTPSEVAKLQGFNLDWPKDFPGDLYIEAGVKAGGVDHPMSPPFDGVVTVEGGRVHSVLRRKLLTPVDATQGLTIRAYDPYYYNEYTITALPRLEGAPPAARRR